MRSEDQKNWWGKFLESTKGEFWGINGGVAQAFYSWLGCVIGFAKKFKAIERIKKLVSFFSFVLII
ncbi:hypothetical protein A3850_001730 [Lewinella sp. 4G2]|nr:hypothetical protein A3850_001730 [Lewinella sp. 4G2]